MHTYYFEKLHVWQDAKKFAVYKITETFPKSEKYSLTDQLRRSALSISANIAEDSTRQYPKDYCRFLNVAFGSAVETLNHLLIAKDLNYISEDVLKNLRTDIAKITNQLRSLNNSVLNSEGIAMTKSQKTNNE